MTPSSAASAGPAPRFPPETLAFLRALKRNNRRDWFQPRKGQYEAKVRAPMIAIIDKLAVDFRRFAPELVASPKVSLYRIYRDTRFSEDKTPYKTHVAASFPWRGLPRHEGAGVYFHLAPDGLWIGGGMYAPPAPQLHAVREHIAANLGRLRRIIAAPGFKKTFGALEGSKLQRVPRGFSKDHKAAELLKHRQFLAGVELPAPFASDPTFYRRLLGILRQAVPLVRFLNEPLAASRQDRR
ncbi:MAG TPA: DUF2461 domain-containing protein [Vicinamibacterales bacterium]|nr:DUF2461 domain-containing protein [Vicinamibacterales bacterium]